MKRKGEGAGEQDVDCYNDGAPTELFKSVPGLNAH